MDWEGMLAILLIFGGPILVVFVVCLFRFLKSRMQHKEILAAIEKGVAIPDLRTAKPLIPRWITNIALGIALIVLSPAFVLHGIGTSGMKGLESLKTVLIYNTAFPTLICFSIGLFFLIRGLLLRKHEKDNQPPKPPTAG